MLVGGMDPLRGRWGKAGSSDEAILTDPLSPVCARQSIRNQVRAIVQPKLSDDLRLLDLDVEPYHQWLGSDSTVADTTGPSRNHLQWIGSRITEGLTRPTPVTSGPAHSPRQVIPQSNVPWYLCPQYSAPSVFSCVRSPSDGESRLRSQDTLLGRGSVANDAAADKTGAFAPPRDSGGDEPARESGTCDTSLVAVPEADIPRGLGNVHSKFAQDP
ncbi:hypothetical protein AnigIFM63604_004242 [Aspergillus niger]|uniref:Uncharacterized protein n=1 Tax=Aspergillus niger TaxID=5061 RepID=A0A9W6EGF7_ASPNG|nr:hypothetical protein AnigIFM63604_004242 [Aspergillus niger]